MAENKKPNENTAPNNEEIITLTKSEYDLLVARAAAQGENSAAVIDQKAAEEPKWYIRAGHAVRRAGHAVLVGLGTGVLVYTGARLLGLSGSSADDESDDDVPDVDDN